MDVKLTLLVVAALLGLVIKVLVSMQTPTQAVHKKPDNTVRISTLMKQEQIFEVIRNYSAGADMEIAEVKPAERMIILRQDDQLLHRGFWLPIYVNSHNSSGITVVKIGMLPLLPLTGMPEHILRKTTKDLEILLHANQL